MVLSQTHFHDMKYVWIIKHDQKEHEIRQFIY